MSSSSDLNEIAFASIGGVRLGHAQNMTGGTGCTAIVCEGGAVAGCDVRGGGPATHETDLLRPENMVQRIHGVVLAGGSAYGLEACAGVMASLESRGIGFDVGVGVVPIVCGAALFDLYCGDPKCRPDRAMGMSACEAAFQPSPQHTATTTSSSTTTPFNLNMSLSGNKGAGTGAAIGKLCGIKYATKGGVGVYAVEVDGYTMGAVVAVNAVGDVVAPNGYILGGMRRSEETIIKEEEKGEGQEDQTGVKEGRGVFVNSEEYCLRSLSSASKTFTTKKASSSAHSPQMTTNTTIACLVTNAPLTKSECTKLAAVAHDAFARTIRPVHTNADGDSIFVLSTAGRREEEKKNADGITVDPSPPSLPPANPVSLAVLATSVLTKAIIRAIESAEGAYGLPSATEMKRAQ